MALSDRKLKDSLLKAKITEIEKCNLEFKESKSDRYANKKNKTLNRHDYNRRIQCGLLNLSKTTAKFNNVVGKGKYNYVNKINVQIPKSDSKNPNVDMIKNNRNIIAKHNILKTNTDVLKHEALIGLYCNQLAKYTPNFYYTYDIRQLTPIENDEYVMEESEYLTKTKKEKYGILGEFIQNITIGKFLDQSPDSVKVKIVPDFMMQLLFTLYIAGREIGFNHFDLHDENVILTRTDKKYIDYIVPLTPQTYNKIFGTYKNGKHWKLTKNVWIFDNERDDPSSFRVPVTYTGTSLELKKCIFDNVKVGKKYERKYKHFKVSVKTHGYMVKIIDFNFSVVKVDNKVLMSRHTEKLYNDFGFKIPNKSLMFIDLYRLCYIMYSNYGFFSAYEMILMFGRYFEDILVKKIEYVEDMTSSKILKSDLNIYDPTYEYTGQTESKFIYAVDINSIPKRFKNNEDFMNSCFEVFNSFN